MRKTTHTTKLNRLWARLVGTRPEFSNTHIAVNATCVIAEGLLLVILLTNIALGLWHLAIMMGIIQLIALVLYYFSRVRGMYRSVVIAFSVVSYAALICSYFMNFGMEGPTVLGFFLTYLLLIAIIAQRYYLWLTITHLVVMVGLFSIEYNMPQWFTAHYPTQLMHIIDWSVTYFICLAFTYLIIRFLKHNYYTEKVLAEKNAQSVEFQNQKLRELINERNVLFSIVSHDMRSPLNVIQGYLEMISDAPLGSEDSEVRKDLLNLTKSTSVMLLNLLTWSKSQMEGMHINLEHVSVNELVEEKLMMFKSIAERKNVALDFDGTENVILHADKEMTRAILRNLISNAIKFTQAEGSITIRIRNDERFGYIEVADTGVGIPEQKLRDLFSPQIKSTYGTENEKGVGLGLFLCKKFAELQGGAITVKSVVGAGSTFVVVIPKG